MPPYELTDPAVFAFVALPALLVVGVVAGVRYAWLADGQNRFQTARATVRTLSLSLAWMAVWGVAAGRGALREWSRTPPPFMGLVVAVVLVSGALGFGPVGRRMARHVPLWLLVAVQAFRLPLELAMHGLYERGIMPVQMSYAGRNFDVLTGAGAILVAALLVTGRAGRALVWVWNVAGLFLVLNVVTVGVLSTPRIQAFGPDHVNVFVTYVPFVWLPAVMVTAAISGRLVVFRALLSPSTTRG
jgi:hypothetical protein